jgi:precorrin-6B methylase 1
LFYGAKITSVKHLGRTLPEGTSRQNTMPVNLKQLKVVSAKGAIISLLNKEGKQYMAIVNKDPQRAMTVLTEKKNDTPRHVTKELKEEAMKQRYVVPAGDVLLFMLK